MNKKTIAIIFLSVALSGCLPAVFIAGAAGGAAVGGSLIYDKRSTYQIAVDRRISQTAHNLLSSDEELKGRIHINDATFNGVMLVVGQADSQEALDRVNQDIARLQNVSRTYNQVTVGSLSNFKQRSRDTWITSKVKSELIAQKGLNSSQIKVITENNVVYLMGILTPQQAVLATEVSRRISGVERVIKVFESEQ